MQVKSDAEGEHSAIHSTFIKLPFFIKTFVLSFFEWPLETGFTVHVYVNMKKSAVTVKEISCYSERNTMIFTER